MAQNTFNQTQKSKTDIEGFLRMMDVATALRQQGEEVQKQLNIDEIKADLLERIKKTADVTGEKLTDDQINSAIDSYFSGLYAFKEPNKDFGYKLAEAYVDRTKIFRKYVVPAVVASAVVVTGIFTVDAISTAHKKSLEENVENKIKSAYDQKVLMIGETQTLEVPTAIPKKFIDEAKLIDSKSDAQTKLRSTDEFFSKYCSDGTSQDDITQENFEVADKEFQNIQSTLDAANRKISEGKEVINAGSQLQSTKKGLDLLIAEIRNNDTPSKMLQNAETAYTNGITSVEARNLAAANSYKNELSSIKTNTLEFKVLPQELEKVYSSIKTISKDPVANQASEKWYNEAKAYVENVNIVQLKNAVNELKNIDVVLNQEYKLVVVSRPGVKSGMDRYYTDENGRRASGFYLILEAVDRNGNTLRRNITNEESGRTESVSMWGERVPEEVFLMIKKDKSDGIIDNNVFGRKERGYLAEKVTMKGPNGRTLEKKGQITNW